MSPHIVFAVQLSPNAFPRGCIPVSHLSFADDMVIFMQGQRGDVTALLNFLDLYQQGSGEWINNEKSFFIVSSRCSVARSRLLSHWIGMSRRHLPLQYLGCTLSKGGPKRGHFQHLIDRIQLKLAGWKNKLLSAGGRTVLIKHVLFAIPQYTMAILEPPKTVLQDMERIMAKFFWGETDGRDKRHQRAWKRLCRPIEEDGVRTRKTLIIFLGFQFP